MGFQYQLQVTSPPPGNTLQTLVPPDGREWRIKEIKLREALQTLTANPPSNAFSPSVSDTSVYHDLLILWELYEDDQ